MTASRRRRPIRGGIAGFLLGLGLTLMVILYDLPVPGDLVLVGCTVLGVLLGLFGPARRSTETGTG
ncbi:MAG: hypothetical protein MUF09_01940 [Candidatus Nanopelagicales bacterium]|jgi:hypothetical protein|nr:hypothetical protein [Candidatus Nanopelagicales bacterium]